MKLLAISDLHLSSTANMQALLEMPAFPDDWLIVAGDVAEGFERFEEGLVLLRERFAKVIWVPGNHDLWTVPGPSGRGVRKYEALVEIARKLGVVTPEDPYLIWPGGGEPCAIVPAMLLYDYSFRPPDVPLASVITWAREERSVAGDEMLLDPSPFASISEWCHHRCRETELRLAALGADVPKIIINHYPLRRDLVYIPRIPRFAPWCGTVLTEDWHVRFNVRVAVSGHLHVRRTDWRDATRFEEVSFGYPPQWDPRLGMAAYLRPIWPASDAA
ncbi:metallophosphoesterase family protein [Hyphomicrobium sp.]|uniref:metallophosphoesterase family protein n=1 Tax=Hyphomicrobium sp. TaxID=82 RepID=UPI003F72994B